MIQPLSYIVVDKASNIVDINCSDIDTMFLITVSTIG